MKTLQRAPDRTAGERLLADRAAEQRRAGRATPTHDGPGNQALMRLLADGVIKPKLNVSQPSDSEELEADRMADAFVSRSVIHRKCATCEEEEEEEKNGTKVHRSAIGAADPHAAIGGLSRSVGTTLPPSSRREYERFLEADLSHVRVHTGPEAQRAARALNAAAFTIRNDIFFGAKRFDTRSTEGRRLIVHELSHALRPAASGRISRQDADKGGTTGAGPAASTATADVEAGRTTLVIPKEQLQEPGGGDLLVLITGGRLVALPASGNYVAIGPLPKGQQPVEPLVTVPTIGKESLALVNAGGRMGFQVDAGGGKGVLFAPAMAEAQRALGVQTVKDVVISHIHDDHANALVALVRAHQIRPENIFTAAAFLVPSNKTNTVANAFQQMQSDPTLQAFGHGPQAKYGTIATPTENTFIQTTITRGDLRIDLFGLTSAFQKLEEQRRENKSQTVADRASLVTRVEHLKTGERTLYISDPRGEDLTLLRQAMGDARYNEMVRGVHTIHNFQHHLGALKEGPDRGGLTDLITRTYVQSGSLTIIAQSQERSGQGQYLNRSMIKALTDIGIDVHVAGVPQGGQIGTLTVMPTGTVTARGPGLEAFEGNKEMQGHVQRLATLNEAEGVLMKYEKYLKEEYRYSSQIRQAREDLERGLRDYIKASISGIRTGSAGRAQSSLTPAGLAGQNAALTRIRPERPIEAKLQPAYLAMIRELNRIGPYREIFDEEVAKAKTSGRLSERGINALWEVSPEQARALLGSSDLGRPEQKRVAAQLPGQPIGAGPRGVALFMLAIEITNLAAPFVVKAQADAEDKNVGQSLADVLWWQGKNVSPNVKGVASYWLKKDPEPTSTKADIQKWIDDKELSYLVITGIDDDQWIRLTIWVSGNIKNYVDWDKIISSNPGLNFKGQNVEERTWSYRTGTISRATIGWDVNFTWRESAVLSATLNATAKAMMEGTEKEIATVATGKGPEPVQTVAAPGTYVSVPLFTGKPQAIGRKQFRPGIEKPILYTLDRQRRITGYSGDEQFYVFPKGIVRDTIPEGFVLVGGADYNTYMRVYNSPNSYLTDDKDKDGKAFTFVASPHENLKELLAAKSEDLVDVK